MGPMAWWRQPRTSALVGAVALSVACGADPPQLPAATPTDPASTGGSTGDEITSTTTTGHADEGSTSLGVASSSSDGAGANTSTGSTGGVTSTGSGGSDTGFAFGGEWEGTWSGMCLGFNYNDNPWTMSVADDGVLMGTISGGLGLDGLMGTVGVGGQVIGTVNSVLAGVCDWTGTLTEAGGSGQWQCSGNCQGTWIGEAVP